MSTDRNIGLKIYLDKLARAAGVRTYRPKLSASAPCHRSTAAHAGDANAEAAVSKLPASSSLNGAGTFPTKR